MRADRAADHASQRWAEALERVSPGIRKTVDRAYRQWNGIVREYLRTETGLRLAVGEDSQSVPIKLADGMPLSFNEVMRQFESVDWLLLNRPAILQAAEGAWWMGEILGRAREAWGDEAGPADIKDIERVQQTAESWLLKLDDQKTIQKIAGIEEDVLGAYFFRVPEIRLYWIVIGIIARTLGVSIDALTVVVLAHELAHAYTHLGRDIDNERWETAHFSSSELNIVEGLAQFYTKVICERLQERLPAALQAYEALLKEQGGPYKAHLQWVEGDERGGEIVRVSMIECRSKGITSSSEFASVIRRHRVGVRGRRQGVTN